MARSAHRWLMNAVNEPMVKAAFDPSSPEAGEVVVEIAGCGVCHTDLGFLYEGVRLNHSLPLALGHEVSGRIVDWGPGADEWSGRAVIVPAVIPCGECDLCRRGKGTICRNQVMPGNDIHGGFATHVTVPATGLLVHGGTLSVVGFTLDKVEIRLANLMAYHARALGNWGCVPKLYQGALDLVLDGKIQVLPFVEHHSLEEINAVFTAFHAHELKRRAILVPNLAEGAGA